MGAPLIQATREGRDRVFVAALTTLWGFLAAHALLLEYASLHPLAAADVWMSVARYGAPWVALGVCALGAFGIWSRSMPPATARLRRGRPLAGALLILGAAAHALLFPPHLGVSGAREIHARLIATLSSGWHGLPVVALLVQVGATLALVYLAKITMADGARAARWLAIFGALVVFATFFDVVANAVTGGPVIGHTARETTAAALSPCR